MSNKTYHLSDDSIRKFPSGGWLKHRNNRLFFKLAEVASLDAPPPSLKPSSSVKIYVLLIEFLLHLQTVNICFVNNKTKKKKK